MAPLKSGAVLPAGGVLADRLQALGDVLGAAAGVEAEG